jgi:choline kinase
MAGQGSRFEGSEFKTPKWLIKAKEKTLLEWSINSLPLDICNSIIFIALEDDAIKYNLKELIFHNYKKLIPKIKIHLIKKLTRGQAETALFAEEFINGSLPIGIFNIDTRFDSSTLKKNLLRSGLDGVIGSFISRLPIYSYARTNEDEFVIETAEKRIISTNALTGFYSFSNPSFFFDEIKK